MSWSQRNYRKQLTIGIRNRIEQETMWSRLVILYTALFDAAELPA